MVQEKDFSKYEILKRVNVERAVNAMFQMMEMKSDSNDLLDSSSDDDTYITLNFALNSALEKKHERKFPIRLHLLKHSIYQGNAFTGKGICFVVADKHFKEVEEVLDLDPIASIKKVIKFSTFTKEYRQFKDRREIAAQYDMFFVDSMIRDPAMKAFGSTFFDRKKQPYSVHLNGKIRDKLMEAVKSTFLVLKGSNV
jgi:hypothetical protein